MNILQEFWDWFPLTSEQYAVEGMDPGSDEAEFMFPKYTELLEYGEMLISRKEYSDDNMEEILMILALDNETEDILYILENKFPDAFLTQLIERGIGFPQPSARWQIAELTYRRKPEGYQKYLRKLAEDSHSYVRKRATNAMRYLGLW